jgi:hypothetical protein
LLAQLLDVETYCSYPPTLKLVLVHGHVNLHGTVIDSILQQFE